MKRLLTAIFQRIINWIDSWDDWFNPITVRELQTLMHRRFELLFLSLLFIATITYTMVLYVLETRYDLSPEELGLGFSVCPAICSLYGVLIGLVNAGSLYRSRFADELFSIVPLSPQQQVYGYWAVSCIESIFFNSLCLLFIAIGQLIGPAPYILLLIPLGSFFLSQIITLIFISFFARIKRKWEYVLFVVIMFYPFSGLGLIIVPWIGVITFALQHWQTLVWNQGFGFVSLFILLPIILLLHGYIAYKLAIYGFKTWRKPFWCALLLNFVIYTLFNTIAAALWLGLAALVL
ncbi:MAG: hypothetical protein LBF88_12360 [Planctomycetaceae bacterium]|jgi:hypothetical protein|nr:hypothetical protein [Planctomycetaceae bacterium]